MQDDLTLLATTYAPVCRNVIDKYIIGYHTLQFMESGGIDLSYDDRAYRLEGMWFWPANPGPHVQFHVAAPYESWFHRHIGFTGARVRRWQALGLLSPEPQAAPPGTDWPARFDALIRCARRPDPLSRLEGINLLERLLIDLAHARNESSPTGEAEWLSRARDLLTSGETPFAPDYEAVAAELGMSASTLRRRFRAATGLSPQEYVVQERIARARALLTETDEPLKAVAELLGYETVHFFARQFHQRAGVTPGVYRRSGQR